MEQTSTTISLVIEQLKESIELLQLRHEEMSTEVVQFFNEHNLEAIERLMEEKKSSMKLQNDLTNLVEKWTGKGVIEGEIRDVS